jgi:uncharacterized OB-fold protein
VVAWVELPEQPCLRVLANIVECLAEEVEIGQYVKVTFIQLRDGVRLPAFHLDHDT